MTRIGLTRDENHTYTANYDGEVDVLPGVTGILRVLNKPALVPWAQGIVAEAAIAHRGDLEKWVEVGGVEGAVGLLKKAATAKRDTAASIGSQVHAIADAIVKGQPVTIAPELAPFVKSYQEWLERFAPEVIAAEEMVVGDGYGGTLDLIASIAGEVWLLDLKSSRGVYAETSMQLAAYGYANFIGRPDDPVKYALPKIDQYGVIHVRPEGAQLIPYDVTDREYAAFQQARALSRWFSQRANRVIGQAIGPALLSFPAKVPA